MKIIPDSKLYPLHQEYDKHDHSYHVGHVHLNQVGQSAGLESYIIMCPACGDFRIWHAGKHIEPEKKVGEWHHMYNMVMTDKGLDRIGFAVRSHNDPDLTKAWKDYVDGCRSGHYIPKEG